MESKEKKTGCTDLDWDKLLPRQDDEPPKVLVVTTATVDDRKQSPPPEGGDQQDQSQRDDILRMSDKRIEEAIIRQRHSIETLSLKLGDKGAKLRAYLMRLEEEMERRKQHRLQKDDAKCEKLTQSTEPCSTSTSDGLMQEALTSLPSSQSVFATHFFKKLEENTDSRTVNAFEGELSYLGRCDRRKMKPNRKVLQKGRAKTGSSTRQSPFQCPTKMSIDVDKHIDLNGDQNNGQCSTQSPHHSEEKLFGSISKRKASQDLSSNDLRPRNGKSFVIVDEEDPELTELMDQADKVDECMKECKIYYPSSYDPESIEIRYLDMECVAPKAYLSSTIMNFYIRYLQQSTSPTDRSTCDYHFFNTYFYEKLKEAVLKKNDQESSFVKFRRWWKGVKIFHKSYILLPIHECLHWSLVIICIPDKEDESGPIILHLDSLGLHCSKLIFDNIKSFLREEWRYLNHGDVPPDLPIAERIWKNLPRRIEEKPIAVPQQRNDYDCGLFVLFFMERFIDEAPQRLKKKDLAMFGKKWFRPEEASNLRLKIQKLLLEEFRNATNDKCVLNPEPLSSVGTRGERTVHPIDC
ncbi:Ubiquitin-like-specific protease [Actinidia chinensis var. chinensis]|uniref:Ubiquitin-like-specific protease n=1 Tax=Actinidia chinensis var. chinensis TaxID=1590841 RepID=A0A2R6RF43_ACTCC|nr:Ubiquitin-like-specific protease [Actinidia chinensis var. chinensis]